MTTCENLDETTKQKLLLLFESKVRRGTQACLNGVASFRIDKTSSGISMKFRSQFGTDKCSFSFMIYQIKTRSKFLGYLVFEYTTRTMYVFLFQDILSAVPPESLERINTSELEKDIIKHLVASTPEGSLTLKREIVEENSWIATYMLLLDKIFEEKPACADLVSQSQKIKVDVPLRHPEASALQDCPGFRSLLESACDQKFTPINYARYSRYADDFIDEIVQSSSSKCFGGKVNVICNLMERWAEVSRMRPQSCFVSNESKNKLTVISVHLTMGLFKRGEQDTGLGEDQVSRHAMVLIIDDLEKQVELFEPNGADPAWVPLVFDALQKYFVDYQSYDWIDAHEFCPRLGIQSVSAIQKASPSGFCAYFSLLWVYLRVTCSSISRRELSAELLSEHGRYIDPLITGLQCQLIAFVDRKERSWRISKT